MHHKETGLFKSQLADGILGLAPKCILLLLLYSLYVCKLFISL